MYIIFINNQSLLYINTKYGGKQRCHSIEGSVSWEWLKTACDLWQKSQRVATCEVEVVKAQNNDSF